MTSSSAGHGGTSDRAESPAVVRRPSRAAATEMIAQRWRSRRLESFERSMASNRSGESSGNSDRRSLTTEKDPTPPSRPWCVVFQRAVADWQKTTTRENGVGIIAPTNLGKQGSSVSFTTNADPATLTSTFTPGTPSSTPSALSPSPTRTSQSDSGVFPSVLRILQQEALRRHVEDEWRAQHLPHQQVEMVPPAPPLTIAHDTLHHDLPKPLSDTESATATLPTAAETPLVILKKKHADPRNSAVPATTSTSPTLATVVESTTSSPPAPSLWSVLPAGYDWNRAVLETVHRRSRAFLLLDVAAVIRTLVTWQRQYHLAPPSSSTSSSSKLQFLYTVQSNADRKLLQLLHRSRVGLVTTSQWDVARCQQVLSSSNATHARTTNTSATALYDNAATTGKSDGYLRALVDDAGVRTVAVDGPDEVRRIQATVQRCQARRRRQRWRQQPPPDATLDAGPVTVHFVLRLPPLSSCREDGNDQNNNNNDDDAWCVLVRDTCAAIVDISPASRLVGVSLDVRDCNHDKVAKNQGDAPMATSENPAVNDTEGSVTMTERLRTALDRLWSMLEIDPARPDHGEDDVVARVSVPHGGGAESFADAAEAWPPSWRIDLTGVLTAPFAPVLVAWWEYLSRLPHVRAITVDVTTPLVAPAAALCTRIIGVKQEAQKQDPGGESSVMIGDAAPSHIGAVLPRRHYYIDDGCYGSLYQGKHSEPLCPLPLFALSVGNNDDDEDDTANLDDSDPTSSPPNTTAGQVHPSTVWGPTCDGLDKVCPNIPLPVLRRDDWLVFPNRGTSTSEGLGTAFNGFNPPDTVYCVLGYFS